MVTKLSHTPIFVLDQDSAIDFYVNKLGFELKNDVPMSETFRWITVSPPSQPDLEIILMKTAESMALDAQSATALRELVVNGKMGMGVFFTEDIYATFADLKAKGVQFKQEPTEQFYGIEAVLIDDSGNWFSLTQPKPH